MMRRFTIPLVLVTALLAGCASKQQPQMESGETLAKLHRVEPDVEEADIEQGLDQAMEYYRKFLEETPETAMTPEAMRRLADLQLEKQFGVVTAPAKERAMVAPEPARPAEDTPAGTTAADAGAAGRESDRDFELRTTAAGEIPEADDPAALPADTDAAGPLEAIALYDQLLDEYPDYEHRDQVLYQKARAYDELGRTEEAITTMERLIAGNPYSEHYDEVQFRRGEYFFTRRRYLDAEGAYGAIIRLGESSSYYELALYKLGWTFYKQELYEEALHRYIALLDYKVSVGYDFDEAQAESEDDERRVADTFRVVSLSFSNLGGPESVPEYFLTYGSRSYEDRVYRNLGDHYLTKLRYDDAAKAYRGFVELYPFHREAPYFSMRVVDTFTQGGFPKLVLESKREFASRYGLQAEYWRHFTPDEAPEVLDYLKANLNDLATHYHAEYQAFDAEEEQDEKIAAYSEALRWYGDYLESFPADAETPSMNYRLADLLLENEDFGEAARQYERTAYAYEPHEQSAAAGYAAVYAYRQQLGVADESSEDGVKRATIASSLRFADTFPDHEHAATVLGAAADDMYEMKDYEAAVDSAQRVLDTYAEAEPAVRRAAWIVVAHGSFERADYPRAEQAYAQVLAATPDDDESHPSFVDNLAASIYKQGELARDASDYQAAADNFLRIRDAAPTSTIRPTAEYDAGAALIELENWVAAADVLEAFRSAFPEHELRLEATRMLALAYRENGDLARAADEYTRIAGTSEDPTMQSEALLVAGDLYEQSDLPERALDVYERYVETFPQPVETALETRSKIAAIHKTAGDDALYHEELAAIVRIDAEAGDERTGRTRTLAGRSALVLAELTYRDFVSVELLQPFEVSLKEKKRRMDETIEAMGHLADYEIGEITAAATYYAAETYFEFSRALMESERPTDLEPADLSEYELVLEEEAFPFEEKAIGVHEDNLELLQAGVFNDWTDKSLGKLAERVPGRYARSEISSEFNGTIERYVYVRPECRFPDGQTATERTTKLEPRVESEGAMDDANPQ